MVSQPFSGGVDALAADQAFDLYADRGKGDQVDASRRRKRAETS